MNTKLIGYRPYSRNDRLPAVAARPRQTATCGSFLKRGAYRARRLYPRKSVSLNSLFLAIKNTNIENNYVAFFGLLGEPTTTISCRIMILYRFYDFGAAPRRNGSSRISPNTCVRRRRRSTCGLARFFFTPQKRRRSGGARIFLSRWTVQKSWHFCRRLKAFQP